MLAKPDSGGRSATLDSNVESILFRNGWVRIEK